MLIVYKEALRNSNRAGDRPWGAASSIAVKLPDALREAVISAGGRIKPNEPVRMERSTVEDLDGADIEIVVHPPDFGGPSYVRGSYRVEVWRALWSALPGMHSMNNVKPIIRLLVVPLDYTEGLIGADGVIVAETTVGF